MWRTAAPLSSLHIGFSDSLVAIESIDGIFCRRVRLLIMKLVGCCAIEAPDTSGNGTILSFIGARQRLFIIWEQHCLRRSCIEFERDGAEVFDLTPVRLSELLRPHSILCECSYVIRAFTIKEVVSVHGVVEAGLFIVNGNLFANVTDVEGSLFVIWTLKTRTVASLLELSLVTSANITVVSELNDFRFFPLIEILEIIINVGYQEVLGLLFLRDVQWLIDSFGICSCPLVCHESRYFH